MKIVRSPIEMKNLSLTIQSGGETIGLVPTMGALHKGHLSLLERAKSKCGYSVVSVFVNPIQFGPTEDFQKYPRPFDKDCELAEAAGCDFLFAPSPQEMYPANYNTYVAVENITNRLCGAARPGHFKGVTTVVLKLFNIVNPQIAVFGQKDAQQVIVIKRMAQDLNLSVQIDVAPIIRETDGLAMSSRNAYLTSNERNEAPQIFNALSMVQGKFDAGEHSADTLRALIKNHYEKLSFINTEYVEIVDVVNVEHLQNITSAALVAVACRTKESKTRLIDNIIIGGAL